jgi:hypothetical protein
MLDKIEQAKKFIENIGMPDSKYLIEKLDEFKQILNLFIKFIK